MRTKIKPFLNTRPKIEDITTVHGISQFTLWSGTRLVIWTLMMITVAFLTASFIVVIKRRYYVEQLFTQIDATCQVNQVPFPAVIICNFNLVSVKETENIASLLRYYGKTQTEIERFFQDLPYLKKYDKYEKLTSNHTEIMKILKFHYFTVDAIMEDVHQKCENLMVYCSFNRKEKKCSNIFSLIKTYDGHCCAFNYAALNDATEDPFMPQDEDMEYYDEKTTDDKKPTGDIVATSEFGSTSGLSVIFNVEPNDYPSWPSVPYYGSKIMITDPSDYPETSVLYKFLIPGESMDIKVEPLIFQSDGSVRNLDPERRACWFHNEVILDHTDRYSFETCNTECNMKSFVEFCGCLPYKYPREKSTRICDFEDLPCLNNMTVHATRKLCKPECYMECRDKSYRITNDLVPFLKEHFPVNATLGRNLSELSALQVYFGMPNCNCYNLTLLMDIDYLIATYGGVFSLSFGGSVITLFEFLFLFLYFLVRVLYTAV